jgi:hypothetical protein
MSEPVSLVPRIRQNSGFDEKCAWLRPLALSFDVNMLDAIEGTCAISI